MSLFNDSYKVHALCLGDTGSGKTGSLISLIEAGYFLRILDLENGTRILANFVRERCPERAENVIVERIGAKYKIDATGASPEKASPGLAKVGRTIDRWQKECSPSDILIVDSLTALGTLCLVWSKSVNPGLRDNRQHYFNAQEVVEPIVATLTHEDFPCHTIILTHIDYRDLSSDPKNPSVKGFTSSVGRALGDKIPRHFNEVFRYQIKGTGRGAKRVISSVSDALVSVKNTAPSRIKGDYGIDTGLAEIFNTLTQE